MSDDEKDSSIDGTGFAGDDSHVMDGSPLKPKKGNGLFMWTMIIVVIAITVAVILGFYRTDEPILESEVSPITQEIPKKDEVMERLQTCIILLIKIQDLIDQMEPEDGGYKLNSIPEEKQQQYNESYNAWFNLYCNKIEQEVKQTDAYQNFNNTRQNE